MENIKLKKIPKVAFPSVVDYDIDVQDEKVVDLKGISDRIVCASDYFSQGVPGAPKSCYLREGAADLLVKAAESLPDGLMLKVFDGWRPYVVQKRLWNMYYADVKNNPANKGLPEEELIKKTSFYVSNPETPITKPFLHNTGGAVDVTIIDKNYKELDMGTGFDAFGDKAWTNYYEETAEGQLDLIIKENRRLLYWTMINAGFTNLPSEWWHYDYGTKFWGYFKNTAALYLGLPSLDNIKVFPLK